MDRNESTPPEYMEVPQPMSYPLVQEPYAAYNGTFSSAEHFDLGPSDTMQDDWQNECGNFPRRLLTKEQNQILEAQFQTHPKPNSMTKRQLAAQTGLTLRRVANWFQNRQARAKHERKAAKFSSESFDLATRSKRAALGTAAIRSLCSALSSMSPTLNKAIPGNQDDKPLARGYLSLYETKDVDATNIKSLDTFLQEFRQQQDAMESGGETNLNSSNFKIRQAMCDFNWVLSPPRSHQLTSDPEHLHHIFEDFGTAKKTVELAESQVKLAVCKEEGISTFDSGYKSCSDNDGLEQTGEKPWLGVISPVLSPLPYKYEETLLTTLPTDLGSSTDGRAMATDSTVGSQGLNNHFTSQSEHGSQTVLFSGSSDLSSIESDEERSFVRVGIDQDEEAENETESAQFLRRLFARQILIDFRNSSSVGGTASHGNASTSSSSKSQKHVESSSSSSSTFASNHSSNKRPSGHGTDSENAGNQDEGRQAKKPCRPSTDRATIPRLLACPYFRFDSSRYSEHNSEEMCYRGCSSVCLRDISRLKQHLYRVHQRPKFYCGRCNEILQTEHMLDEHARQDPACQTREPLYREKMSKTQMNAIKRRNVGRLPHEEWLHIFKILFPDASPPSSSLAYVGNDFQEAIRDFVTYFEREAPARLSSWLQPVFRNHTLTDLSQSFLDEAAEDASAQLVSMMRTRLDGMTSSVSNTQFDALPTEEIYHATTVAGAGISTQQISGFGESLSSVDLCAGFQTEDEWYNFGFDSLD